MNIYHKSCKTWSACLCCFVKVWLASQSMMNIATHQLHDLYHPNKWWTRTTSETRIISVQYSASGRFAFCVQSPLCQQYVEYWVFLSSDARHYDLDEAARCNAEQRMTRSGCHGVIYILRNRIFSCQYPQTRSIVVSKKLLASLSEGSGSGGAPRGDLVLLKLIHAPVFKPAHQALRWVRPGKLQGRPLAQGPRL